MYNVKEVRIVCKMPELVDKWFNYLVCNLGKSTRTIPTYTSDMRIFLNYIIQTKFPDK
jgi:hypothetical protein